MQETVKCRWHLCNNPVRTTHLGASKYCSTRCKNKWNVSTRRQRLKLMAIEYMGGKCADCRYDKCPMAFDFHHLDGTTKEFGISRDGHTRSWERMKTELDKCVLLCANCHRERHAAEAKNFV